MSTPAAAALSDAGTATPAGAAPTGATPAPGAAATPASNDGKFWGSWNLPEQKETREWVANKNYDSPFTLAKTAQTLEREAATLRAGKGYPTPGPDGKIDPNADKAWRALTGVPETADKYDIPVPENNPYPQFKGFMAEELLKAGVPAAMAPALAKGYEAAVGKMEAQLKADENARSEHALAELKNAWGANYQERVALGARGKEWLAGQAGGLNEMQLRVLENVMGTDKFMTAMWKLGAGNAEGSFAGDNLTGGRSFAGGASEAQAKIDQLTAERSAGRISQSDWAKLNGPDGDYTKAMKALAAGFAPGNA